MAVEKSLVSGSMTMLLLGLLKEKDMYGYEMIDSLRQKSRNVFELKAGTLYPLLHGMEEKGLLTAYAAQLDIAAPEYNITEESLQESFRLIRQDWQTGET